MCKCGKNPNTLYCGEGDCVGCLECRTLSPMGHEETCSKWKHIYDDHPNSACSRGTCKHCNPEYRENKAISFSEAERDLLLDIVEYFESGNSWEGISSKELEMAKDISRKLKF